MHIVLVLCLVVAATAAPVQEILDSVKSNQVLNVINNCIVTNVNVNSYNENSAASQAYASSSDNIQALLDTLEKLSNGTFPSPPSPTDELENNQVTNNINNCIITNVNVDSFNGNGSPALYKDDDVNEILNHLTSGEFNEMMKKVTNNQAKNSVNNIMTNNVNVNSFNGNSKSSAFVADAPTAYGFSPADTNDLLERITSHFGVQVLIKIFKVVETIVNEIVNIKNAVTDFAEKLKEIIQSGRSTYGIKDTVKDSLQALVRDVLIPAIEGSLDVIMGGIEMLLDIAIAAITGLSGSDSIRENLKYYLDSFLDGYYTKILNILQKMLDFLDPSQTGPDTDLESIKEIVTEMVKHAVEELIKQMKDRIADKIFPGSY